MSRATLGFSATTRMVMAKRALETTTLLSYQKADCAYPFGPHLLVWSSKRTTPASIWRRARNSSRSARRSLTSAGISSSAAVVIATVSRAIAASIVASSREEVQTDLQTEPSAPPFEPGITPPKSSESLTVGHDRLELSANGLRERDGAARSEAFHVVAHVEGDASADRDPPCFPLLPDDSSRIVTAKGAECTSDGAVEAALAGALAKAADAGRFDVVAQLARELEARRLARVGNVVTLDAKARKR
jgi:hypothetical protein